MAELSWEPGARGYSDRRSTCGDYTVQVVAQGGRNEKGPLWGAFFRQEQLSWSGDPVARMDTRAQFEGTVAEAREVCELHARRRSSVIRVIRNRKWEQAFSKRWSGSKEFDWMIVDEVWCQVHLIPGGTVPDHRQRPDRDRYGHWLINQGEDSLGRLSGAMSGPECRRAVLSFLGVHQLEVVER